MEIFRQTLGIILWRSHNLLVVVYPSRLVEVVNYLLDKFSHLLYPVNSLPFYRNVARFIMLISMSSYSEEIEQYILKDAFDIDLDNLTSEDIASDKKVSLDNILYDAKGNLRDLEKTVEGYYLIIVFKEALTQAGKKRFTANKMSKNWGIILAHNLCYLKCHGPLNGIL